jgi:hypothetical protein
MSIENYNLDSVNPKKLIIQEGEDTGKIADIDLARIGAEAEDNCCDECGIEAMVIEVGRRADMLMPLVGYALKDYCRVRVEERFKLELDVKKNERQAVIDAKAMGLLVKLTDEELTYANLPKPHYDDEKM